MHKTLALECLQPHAFYIPDAILQSLQYKNPWYAHVCVFQQCVRYLFENKAYQMLVKGTFQTK